MSNLENLKKQLSQHIADIVKLRNKYGKDFLLKKENLELIQKMGNTLNQITKLERN